MQANRIGPARASSAEDTLLGSAQVSARMHLQDAAIGLVQPRQHDDLVADGNAVQAGLNLRIQDQVGVRRTFITLPRRVRRRGERTLHASYRVDCEVDHEGSAMKGTQSQLCAAGGGSKQNLFCERRARPKRDHHRRTRDRVSAGASRRQPRADLARRTHVGTVPVRRGNLPRGRLLSVDHLPSGIWQNAVAAGPSAPEFAVRLAGLCRLLGLADLTVVGISLGARSALTLAAFYPELVQRVILLCPTSFRPWPIPEAGCSRTQRSHPKSNA